MRSLHCGIHVSHLWLSKRCRLWTSLNTSAHCPCTCCPPVAPPHPNWCRLLQPQAPSNTRNTYFIKSETVANGKNSSRELQRESTGVSFSGWTPAILTSDGGDPLDLAKLSPPQWWDNRERPSSADPAVRVHLERWPRKYSDPGLVALGKDKSIASGWCGGRSLARIIWTETTDAGALVAV